MSLGNSILKYPNFARLYYAGLTSEVGSFITETALMLLVFQLSGENKSYLGLTRGVFLLFLTLGNISGGPIGDNFHKKRILIFCDFIRIPLVVLLYFRQDLFTVIAVNGLIAYFTGIFNPTRQALINEIVPVKDITKANALFGSTLAFVHMLGPFVGAWAFAAFNGVREILSFDLLTYFIGIFFLTKIQYTLKPIKLPGPRKSFTRTIQEGTSFILQRLDLFAIFSFGIIAGLCIGTLIPLILPFTKEVLEKGEKFYGVLMASFGLGGILGSIFSHQLAKHYHLGRIIIFSLCIEVLMMNIWIRVNNFPISCFIFFVWGVMVFIRITTQRNYISRTIPTHYLARIHALSDLSFIVPNIAGGILISLIGANYKTLEILQVVAWSFLGLVLPRLFMKDVRILLTSNVQQVEREEIQI